jgi:hypothetical protein
VAHGFVGRFEQLFALAACASRCAAIPAADGPEKPTEGGKNKGRRDGHPTGEKEEQRSNRRQLRHGTRTAQKPLLKTHLDFTDALRERGHGLSRATDIGTVIAVSWAVQAVKSQEGIEELEPKLAAHLSRHARLDESGVRAGQSLDEDHRQTHGRQKKSAIGKQTIGASRAGEIERRRPSTQRSCQRKGHSSGDERNERMADGVHRGSEHEARQPRDAVQYPP